jgi:hypothetical protein
MSFRFRSLLALSVGVCLLQLVAGTRAGAASSPPKLSGIYAVQFHKFCQPQLLAQSFSDPTDDDNRAFVLGSIGSIRDKIGVLNFNAKQLTIGGSLITVRGAAASEDLTAIGGQVTSTPFTESAGTISGTYSTTDTSITIDIGDGPTNFDAVFGAFSGSTAHVVFFEAVSTDGQGDSCTESGELQFK